VVITGRKSVEGAIVEGMLGLLKRQCRKMALKTRNWLMSDDDEAGGRFCLHATQVGHS
jgi:hypothetical protein